MTHRFVVIGGGSIGKRHIRNLFANGVGHVAAVDPNPDRQAEAKTLGAEAYATFEEALSFKPTACVIASPNIFHADNLRACLTAGLHTLVEKPLAVTSDGLAEIVTEFKAKNLIGHVGSNFKFHPSFRRLKDCLPRIGQIYSARAISGQYLPDWHPWEDYRQGYSANQSLGGGVLLDTHELLYMTWFLGPATAVNCMSGKVSDLEIDTEDLAQLTLRHEAGALSTIQADYLQRTYQRSSEFHGSDGFLKWDVNERTVRLFVKSEEKWTVWEEPRGYDANQMYMEQTRHFLDTITGEANGEFLTPLSDGLAVLRLTEAAKLSQQEARTVTVSP